MLCAKDPKKALAASYLTPQWSSAGAVHVFGLVYLHICSTLWHADCSVHPLLAYLQLCCGMQNAACTPCLHVCSYVVAGRLQRALQVAHSVAAACPHDGDALMLHAMMLQLAKQGGCGEGGGSEDMDEEAEEGEAGQPARNIAGEAGQIGRSGSLLQTVQVGQSKSAEEAGQQPKATGACGALTR
jgi:hypothetical protein